MPISSLIKRLLPLLPPLALLAGCGGPAAPDIRSTDSLPPGELIVLGAALYNGSAGDGFYLLNPASGVLSAWQLQGGRGLSEDGSTCTGADEQLYWPAAGRELLLSGHLGCAEGSYQIAADGAATQQPLPALPAGVEYPKLPLLAPSGEAIAVIGSAFAAPGDYETHLYVGAPGEAPTVYGEGMGFEHIDYLRWSPDEQAIAFTAGTRPDDVYHRRAYYADLRSGEVRALSQDEALIDSAPAFTPDGALIFAGADATGMPAIYRASPGADAAPLLDLGELPEAEGWRGELLLSLDGRLAALSHQRQNTATPETIYVADLEAGALRDLLPADLAVERTGNTEGAGPPRLWPLAWSPDSRRLLVSAEIAGYCRILGESGVVGCTSQLYELPAAGGAPRRLHEAHLDAVRYALWGQ